MDETEESNVKKVREDTRRALQLMNVYELTEFEFENVDENESIKLTRTSTESSPPLLEGRSTQTSGKVRAPSVGTLNWEKTDGESVTRGDLIAEIVKEDERVPVKAPVDGVLTQQVDDEFVEFGRTLAVISRTDSSENSGDT